MDHDPAVVARGSAPLHDPFPTTALFARQYVDMTRGRVEGLLAAFPKLIGSASASSQHTYVETDVVRYARAPP